MRFYEWRLTGIVGQPWENHIFLKWKYAKGLRENPRNPRSDNFISLCEHPLRGQGGHSGENKNEYYCPKCKELAPIFEAELQAKEDARVAELEAQRPSVTASINSFLSGLTIDELLRVPGILDRYFKKK